MTFDELLSEYYDDLDGAIMSVSRVDEALYARFEFDHWKDAKATSVVISCGDVLESTLRPTGIASISRPGDHPLLWQHTQPHEILAFSSAPPNPFELLGRLYSAHEQLFGRWRAPRDYIHATPEMLSGGHGQLAHGPEKAIQSYQQIAQDALQCSVVPQFTPKDSCQLILFDEAFVICRDVSLLDSPETA